MKSERFRPTRRFKVGMIGAGNIAEIHMAAYKHLRNVEVVGICDTIEEKAKTLAEKWNVKKVFSQSEDLLGINQLDLVDICTPTPTHASLVEEVCSHGYDILLEKPMALTVAQCDSMMRQIKKYEINLCVNHHALFYSSIRKAKALVDSGFYNLKGFRVSHKGLKTSQPNWSLNAENGGLLWEVGTHGAYLTLFFLPDITEVYALGNASEDPKLYDNFHVLLRTSSGSIGNMDYSLTSNQREYLCEIAGSSGRRAVANLRHDVLIDKTRYRPKWYRDLWCEGTDLIKSWSKWASRTILSRRKAVEFIRSKTWLIGSYLKSIEEKESPPVTPKQARDTIKLLQCIKESLDTNKTIKFR